MNKPFDFIGHLGMNYIIVETELAKRGFTVESVDSNNDFVLKVYKSSPVIHHIHAKYRKSEHGCFADSFIIY